MSNNPGNQLKSVISIMKGVLVCLCLLIVIIACSIARSGEEAAVYCLVGLVLVIFIWLSFLVIECYADMADNIWHIRKIIVEKNPKDKKGWVCSCGNENLDSSQTCTNCGKIKISDGAIENYIHLRKPGDLQNQCGSNKWVCTCGRTNDQANNFCADCGGKKL